jgi:hypothetical protein
VIVQQILTALQQKYAITYIISNNQENLPDFSDISVIFKEIIFKTAFFIKKVI